MHLAMAAVDDESAEPSSPSSTRVLHIRSSTPNQVNWFLRVLVITENLGVQGSIRYACSAFS